MRPTTHLGTRLQLLSLTLFTSLAPVPVAISQHDWPHWRGPSRDGHTPHLSGWAGDPSWPGAPLFSANSGTGASSPIAVGERLIVSGWHEGREHVLALDFSTGKILWSARYPAPSYGRHAVGDQGFFSGPSSSPEYAPGGTSIFHLGADGDLVCIEIGTGEIIWHVNLYERYKVSQRPQVTDRPGTHRDYGYTSAPLFYRDTLLVEVGGPEAYLVGLDPATGAERWASPPGGPAGHAGGIVLTTAGSIPVAVTFGATHVHAIRLDKDQEGAFLASLPWPTDFANNIATPLAHAGDIFVTSKWNKKTARLAFAPESATGFSELWSSEDSSNVCSPVVVGDLLFWAHNALTAQDTRTGQVRWQDLKVGSAASLIATGDDLLILWSDNGDLSLVDASPDEAAPTVLTRRPGILQDMAWPHPILARGRLVVKDRSGQIRTFVVDPAQLPPAARAALANAAPPRAAGPADWRPPADALVAWRAGGGRRGLAGSLVAPSRARLDQGEATLTANGPIDTTTGAARLVGLEESLPAAVKDLPSLRVELLLSTSSLDQSGPARILSVSRNSQGRNLTIGQQGAALHLRLRTAASDDNGLRFEKSFAEGQLAADSLHHLVLTIADGRATATLDGIPVLDTPMPGSFENWAAMPILLGDEADGGRRWLGEIHAFSLSP